MLLPIGAVPVMFGMPDFLLGDELYLLGCVSLFSIDLARRMVILVILPATYALFPNKFRSLRFGIIAGKFRCKTSCAALCTVSLSSLSEMGVAVWGFSDPDWHSVLGAKRPAHGAHSGLQLSFTNSRMRSNPSSVLACP